MPPKGPSRVLDSGTGCLSLILSLHLPKCGATDVPYSIDGPRTAGPQGSELFLTLGGGRMSTGLTAPLTLMVSGAWLAQPPTRKLTLNGAVTVAACRTADAAPALGTAPAPMADADVAAASERAERLLSGETAMPGVLLLIDGVLQMEMFGDGDAARCHLGVASKLPTPRGVFDAKGREDLTLIAFVRVDSISIDSYGTQTTLLQYARPPAAAGGGGGGIGASMAARRAMADDKKKAEALAKGTAEQLVPTHFSSLAREQAGLVGILNQGATCYLNSVLQTLFHTRLFRKLIYDAPVEWLAFGGAAAGGTVAAPGASAAASAAAAAAALRGALPAAQPQPQPPLPAAPLLPCPAAWWLAPSASLRCPRAGALGACSRPPATLPQRCRRSLSASRWSASCARRTRQSARRRWAASRPAAAAEAAAAAAAAAARLPLPRWPWRCPTLPPPARWTGGQCPRSSPRRRAPMPQRWPSGASLARGRSWATPPSTTTARPRRGATLAWCAACGA